MFDKRDGCRFGTVIEFRGKICCLFPDRRLLCRFEELCYGVLASGSTLISEVVPTLLHRLQRLFHNAKALYRFLDNPG